MEKLDYPAYGRELYKTTLANGLKINLLPMPDYHKTYAILTTDFGSVDNTFVIDGQQQTVPNGVAHFLEHKLFEKADHDAFVIDFHDTAQRQAILALIQGTDTV